LERVEQGTVGIKLAVIAGLIAGLISYAIPKAATSGLDFSGPDSFGWESIAIALGLIITVQGFETSRYLGDEFDAKTRIRTMRLAQWSSTGIYLVYVLLSTLCFTADQVGESETAIIDMTYLVAPVLPAMLVAAALAAQFSAAVADTGGCGGLAEEISAGRLKAKSMYIAIGILGTALTWIADIYAIIAYASRAFAVYYAVQCLIALTLARKAENSREPRHKALTTVTFLVLAAVAMAVVLFGRPAD
jgi:hypothetical protein